MSNEMLARRDALLLADTSVSQHTGILLMAVTTEFLGNVHEYMKAALKEPTAVNMETAYAVYDMAILLAKSLESIASLLVGDALLEEDLNQLTLDL